MNEREVLELLRGVAREAYGDDSDLADTIDRRLSALPAPDEKLGTLPPSKTLNECREVFRRVAKRGPCLSSPDLHGIAAVRDFLTLDEEAFRRNWGPRDEDDDEKCEGGECRHGFDAGGGERLTECEKHGGKPAPSPQPAREAQGEPTLEECETAYDEAWRNADIGSLSVDDIKNPGVAAVRALCLSRAPSPVRVKTSLVEHPLGIEVHEILSDGSRRFVVVVPKDSFCAPSPSPALAAIVEAGDTMRENYLFTLSADCDGIEDDPPESVQAWDRARAALPKGGAA